MSDPRCPVDLDEDDFTPGNRTPPGLRVLVVVLLVAVAAIAWAALSGAWRN